MMEKRPFQQSCDKISLLGFGMMRLPMDENQKIDRRTTAAMIDAAVSAGVNYFDTAYPYHEGDSENVAGEFLSAYDRSSYFLADKMPIWEVNSPGDVVRIFNDQLKKCRTDYFDFYLLHNMSWAKMAKVDAMKAYDYLSQMKKEGKIRRLGFSFHDTPDALKRIAGSRAWDFAQIQLNYLDWELLDAKGQYEILTEHGLPVAVMEPVRGGALAQLCPEAIDILKAAQPDKSPASWAIRFAASCPNVYTVLSGMSSPAQLADNIATMTDFTPLSDADRDVLAQALATYRKKSPIPCTACRYCMDCPNGVDIPSNFSIYNRLLTSKNEIEFLNSYNVIGEAKQAKNCIGCGLCRDKCPQKLDIPALMPKIAETYQNTFKPVWFD